MIELLVIVAVIFLFALMIGAPNGEAKRKAKSINCIYNLRQVGLACHVWDGDNGKYPMSVSVTNGGAKELAAAGNVMGIYLAMSNELSTPKVLYCPADLKRNAAMNFGPSFTATNVSYFAGLDANEDNPHRILSGDDHLQVGSIPTRPELFELSTNLDVEWTSARHATQKKYFWMPDPHQYRGNIGFADGSVKQLDTDRLRQALGQTGLATNRLVMP